MKNQDKKKIIDFCLFTNRSPLTTHRLPLTACRLPLTFEQTPAQQCLSIEIYLSKNYNIMSFSNFTYLILMLASVAVPLAMSFEKNISYVKKWKYLVPAIVLPGIIFIVWDIYFTKMGIWSFNSNYVTGLYIAHLPIEEWSFFVVIPFCCIFIYEVLKYYLKPLRNEIVLKLLLYVVVFASSILAIYNYAQTYTFVTLLLIAIFTIIVLNTAILYKKLAHMLLAFAISCVPMFIVNGVLTSFPVVEYNSQYFSNLRLGTIPIEDFAYFFLLLIMNVFVYEFFQFRNKKKSQ